jgi:hypothetical protein
MNRSTYYRLYDAFNKILERENPCKFINNCCIKNRSDGSENGCCGTCAALSSVGCSVQALRCKSQLCNTAFLNLSIKGKDSWRKLMEDVEEKFPSLLNRQTYTDIKSEHGVKRVSSMLDGIANKLEAKGLLKEAYEIDLVANAIDKDFHELSKQLEEAYKRHAPQDQIDHLETELAKLVSEEDMLGHTPATSDGQSIEEELRSLYHQYLNAGNTAITPYTREELLDIMRGAIKEFPGNRSDTLNDAQILEAAKDAYERRKTLNKRREEIKRVHKTPEEALTGLMQIKTKGTRV